MVGAQYFPAALYDLPVDFFRFGVLHRVCERTCTRGEGSQYIQLIGVRRTALNDEQFLEERR